MKNKIIKLLAFLVVALTFNTSCKKQDASANPTITVTTKILDSTTSPIIIGGTVVAGIKDIIIEKGVLVGSSAYLNLDNCPNANFNYTSPKLLPTNFNAGGWSIPASTNISINSGAGTLARNASSTALRPETISPFSFSLRPVRVRGAAFFSAAFLRFAAA